MVRTILKNASTEKHIALAHVCNDTEGFTSEDVIPWLKSIKYQYEGEHYNATLVKGMVIMLEQGYKLPAKRKTRTKKAEPKA
jgi:hypothetical protein